MLKRLRNRASSSAEQVLLCGLIVGTCSHAALCSPIAAHIGLWEGLGGGLGGLGGLGGGGELSSSQIFNSNTKHCAYPCLMG